MILSFQQAKEDRHWSRLAMMGGLYYLIVYAVTGNMEFKRAIVWFGVGLMGLIIIPTFIQHVRLSDLPREGILLALFLLWSSTGFFVATEQFKFVRYLQLLAELTLIVIGIGLILRYSGEAKWFFLAFLAVSVAAVFSIGHPLSMTALSSTDPFRAELDAANAFGFTGALGFFAALALLPETKRLCIRFAIIACGILAFYSVLLSASRTAFLAALVTASFWPILCMASTSRFRLRAVIPALIVLCLLYIFYGFIINETYMGARFMRSVHVEDNSTKVRLDLAVKGLSILVNNPLFGCGLGGFGVVSGTGFYAHNEFIEIAATTGLPGIGLYYSMYWITWRRLTRSLAFLTNPLFRYRVNIARLALLMLVITGFISTPNFLSKPSMFLLAVVVGMANWAERITQWSAQQSGIGNRWFEKNALRPMRERPVSTGRIIPTRQDRQIKPWTARARR